MSTSPPPRNGHAKPTKTQITIHAPPPELAAELDELIPPWVRAMRQAARNTISAEDVGQIVTGAVKAAKAGDAGARNFIFREILNGGPAPKAVTLVQNNFPADPAKPADSRPGTEIKISAMERRAAAGLPLTSQEDGDGTERDLD